MQQLIRYHSEVRGDSTQSAPVFSDVAIRSALLTMKALVSSTLTCPGVQETFRIFEQYSEPGVVYWFFEIELLVMRSGGIEREQQPKRIAQGQHWNQKDSNLILNLPARRMFATTADFCDARFLCIPAVLAAVLFFILYHAVASGVCTFLLLLNH